MHYKSMLYIYVFEKLQSSLKILFLFVGFSLLFNINLATSQTITQGEGVYDIEGNFYTTFLVYNGQEWMAENLKSKNFSNGDSIPYLQQNLSWQNTNSAAFSYYNSDLNLSSTFGNLYNWFTTIDERNVCPADWHVPTDLEWTDFSDYLGGNGVAGGKMKVQDTLFWKAPNLGATNESFFSALPGGCRYDGGNFANIYSYANWWTGSQLDNQFSWFRSTYFDSDNLIKNYATKNTGYSIRCIKNNVSNLLQNTDKILLRISPNPFYDMVTIESSVLNGTIDIYNSAGILIHTFEPSSKSEQINLDFLDKGLYYVHLKYLNVTQKLIKH